MYTFNDILCHLVSHNVTIMVFYSSPSKTDPRYPKYTFAEPFPEHCRFHRLGTCARTTYTPMFMLHVRIQSFHTWFSVLDAALTFSPLSISAYSSSFLSSFSSLACMDAKRL